MTGFDSKRKIALDRLDDDDTQAYKKPWVGLTEEEIDKWTPEIHSVIRIVEQLLKEKNL